VQTKETLLHVAQLAVGHNEHVYDGLTYIVGIHVLQAPVLEQLVQPEGHGAHNAGLL